MWRTTLAIGTAIVLRFASIGLTAEAASPEFAKDVAPIFAKYCAGCHNADDFEGKLSLETFAGLQKGGDRGAAIVPGRADASLLIRVLTGEIEPAMPPEDNPRPTEAEIDILRAWIDAGAKGPDGAEAIYPELSTPQITPAPHVQQYLTSLASAPDGKRLAIGRYRHVDLVDPATRQVLATTPELPGKVNGVSYSSDGAFFVAASGIPGLYGVATICRSADAGIVSQIKGHRDALYDARLSPDNSLLASCSYDRQINLWNATSGELISTFAGHNGAVFELAFSSDGLTLASASADGTVKIWNVKTGERLDTLGQSEGEQSVVAISPDDQWIVAGGADRQVRMWRLLSRKEAQINPLKFSRTAHESSIVQMAFSADGSKLVTASEGRELLLWESTTLTLLHRYEQQPDVVTGIAFVPKGNNFFVTRIDGSWQSYAIEASSEKNGGNETEFASSGTSAATSADESPRLEKAEMEPNNSPAHPNQITENSVVSGVIVAPAEAEQPDVDLFRFHARKGQQFVLEINAAQQKSPLDSKLEVLDSAGNSIPRVLLQAVRPSYFTFRGHNSTDLNDFRVHGAADMELNEYLYANGEVTKLWMLPRGPDSGFIVYPGFSGSRYAYFGTSAIAHALNQPCYVVQPHPPGTKLIPNGLPVFTLYYENDDDGWQKLGADSRIRFTAPADGEYLARVTDVRDQGGNDYKYELTVCAPRPDFKIKVKADDLSINAGSGKEFAIEAERLDDFEGEIRVDIAGLPPGFHVTTPIFVQAEQTTAYGTITADASAPAPTPENSKLAKATASAVVNGQEIKKDAVELGEVKLAERPKFLVQVIPSTVAQPTAAPVSAVNNQATELTIAPGETISAVVKVERNGFDGEVKFGGEKAGRNLPHGVYVDNIGLNGLMLLQGESERKFFITAAKWVPETTRTFHLRSEAEGNQTSWPVVLHVRNRPDIAATEPNIVGASSDAK